MEHVVENEGVDVQVESEIDGRNGEGGGGGRRESWPVGVEVEG